MSDTDTEIDDSNTLIEDAPDTPDTDLSREYREGVLDTRAAKKIKIDSLSMSDVSEFRLAKIEKQTLVSVAIQGIKFCHTQNP